MKIPNLHRISLWFCIIVTLLAIFTFYFQVFKYSVNIPMRDDIYYGIRFVNSLISLDDIQDKITLFLKTNGNREHRVFFLNFFVTLELYLFKEVNFQHWLLFGSLSTLFIWIFSYLDLKKEDKLYFLLPGTLLLFVPIFGFNDFATPALNSFGFLFPVICFYFLNKSSSNKHVFTSLAFANFSLLTFGSGVLVPVLGFIMMFLKEGITKIQKLAWVIVSSFIAFFYFSNNTGNDALTDNYNASLDVILAFAMRFLSSVAPSSLKSNLFIGIVLFILLLYIFILSIKKIKDVNLSFFFSFLFFAGNVAIISLFRADKGAIFGRYQIVSVLTLYFAYLTYLTICKWRPQLLKKMVLALVVLLIPVFVMRNMNNDLLMHRQKVRKTANIKRVLKAKSAKKLKSGEKQIFISLRKHKVYKYNGE